MTGQVSGSEREGRWVAIFEKHLHACMVWRWWAQVGSIFGRTDGGPFQHRRLKGHTAHCLDNMFLFIHLYNTFYDFNDAA